MKRIAMSIALALAAVAVSPAVTAAQPAMALGKPLPDGKLPTGTITVRVVDGSPSSPVAGTDVTLLVNGQPRTARTDATGRATFAGLPVGGAVQAKLPGAEDRDEVASETFPVPGQGGARVMLSTKPFQGTGGVPAQPGAAGMGAMGMPGARAMSGQPRPDRAQPPGTYAVRVTYDDLVMKDGRITDPNPPVGHPVMLAAYGADDTIKLLTATTSAEGVATFEGLDQSGATSYFAMTTLPRGGVTDRLIAVSALLDSQAGAKVVLSGDKRDATTPAIDDYEKLIPREGALPPAGRVRITLDGVGPAGSVIELVDAATGAPVASAAAQRGAPDPAQVRGSANFNPLADRPAGTLVVEIKGGMGTATAPLAGIEVQLATAADDRPIDGARGVTGADGTLQLQAPTGAAVKAVLTINGKPMLSAPMELAAGGGKLDVVAQWPSQGKPEATFDVPHVAGRVLFAQTTMSGQAFRSLPFQTVAEAGSHSNIYVYPRTLFAMDLHAFVEDQLLAMQGSFEVTNYSWAPYRASPDGLLIRLPKGHKGAIVAPQDQGDVAVAQGEGFRIMRPIPPGGRKFRMGYSMQIEDGEVEWTMPLPMGTWGSSIKIRQTPGMSVKLPQGLTPQTQTATTGEPWFVIDVPRVDPGQSLAMTVSGFPREAPWRVWLPRVAGVLVLALMLGGIAFALVWRKREDPAAAAAARRAKLMDELVALEKAGKDGKRREQILAELERLWVS